MPYGLSVDVGTSFTAAAIVRLGDGLPAAPQVLPLGTHTNAVPSVIFMGEDGQSVVGEAAERRGLAHPECLAREFKRRMGDDVPLVVGDTGVLPEDLFATMVRWVVDRAEEREGEPPAVVTLTHPAEWGGHKTGLLTKALAGVGLTDVELLTEPLAAALHYASQERVEVGSTVAVYDFGGGTFDATVLRKTDADTFTVLGTPEGIERLGGADFDQDVFGYVLAGAPETFAGLDFADADVLSAVARLRRECAEAKEALSTDPEATIAVLLPGAHAQVRLVRSEFEAMIEGRVHETIDRLDRAVTSAGVTAEDLTAVLLIGGSSRIPLVAQLISERLGRPVAIDSDPKASIALGAVFATAVLQDTDDDVVASATDTPASRPGGADLGSHTSATHAVAPQHGPHHLTAKKRAGTRAMLVTAAVVLLGVATATAANSPTSMAALSDALTGPEQIAEAAEIPPTEVLAGQEDPSAGGAVAGSGQGGESVPRASWFDTVARPGGAGLGIAAGGAGRGKGNAAPADSAADLRGDVVVADSGAGGPAGRGGASRAPAVAGGQPAEPLEQLRGLDQAGTPSAAAPAPAAPPVPSESDPAGTPSTAPAPPAAPAGTPTATAPPAGTPSATAPAPGVLPPDTAPTGSPAPTAGNPVETPSRPGIPPVEAPLPVPSETAATEVPSPSASASDEEILPPDNPPVIPSPEPSFSPEGDSPEGDLPEGDSAEEEAE